MQSNSSAAAATLVNGDMAGTVSLESVLCTEELQRRPSRAPDFQAQNQAFLALMQELKCAPDNVLQKLAETALELCRGHSAGISLLEEPGPPGRLNAQGDHFRWYAVAGKWAPLIWNTTTPRDYGPCGTVLDRNSALLFSKAHRYFTQFAGVEPLLIEALLVPFHVNGQAVGTVWVVAHDESRKFDAEDQRVLEDLSTFAATAYQVLRDQQALGESERRLRRMIDALPTAIYTTDATGRLTHFNPACVELSGRTPELGSDHWCVTWKLFYPDGRPMPHDECPMAIALKEGRIIREAEAIAERPDGTRIWFTPYPTPLFDDAGNITGGINMLVDITERKLAEVAKARLAAIVESSDDAIITKGLDGFITTWNTGAERLFGYSAQEAIGQPITMLIPTDRRDEEPANIERLRRGERVDHFETKRVRKDGTPLDISLTISPVKDGAGRIVGASKVARDITERKQVEQALRESEERFRMLADSISQLAWICDELGNVTWYNQRWLEYTGLTFEEMREWGWTKCHHPEHVDRVVTSVTRSRDSGEVWEDTFPLRGKDGQYRWFLSRAIPIRDGQGNILRWFGTNTDVTQQLAAEEALRETDRRKNEFLAMLAHELRNPLAPIRNALQILHLKGGDETVQSVFETMERQVGQLVRMVDDLLDVNRISRGKIELRTSRVELAPIVQHAVEAVRPICENRDHDLSVTLPQHPLYLDADPARLAQVLSNLLNNACKFTNNGGRITLTAEQQAEQVVIRVKDNGIGIAADQLPRIFKMFVQADTSLERSVSGLGIGLTLVKNLVEMHRGTVEALSEGIGQGSEFVVRLPISVAPFEPQLPVPAVGKPATTIPRRILVVDDNRDSAKTLAMLLNVTGHQTQIAFDGLEAVAATETFRPDVVLLDIGLPKLNGYETAITIREQPWGKDMLLVALTGWGQDDDRQKSKDAGFDAHLVKPVEHSVLTKLLAELVPQPT